MSDTPSIKLDTSDLRSMIDRLTDAVDRLDATPDADQRGRITSDLTANCISLLSQTIIALHVADIRASISLHQSEADRQFLRLMTVHDAVNEAAVAGSQETFSFEAAIRREVNLVVAQELRQDAGKALLELYREKP